MTPHFAEGREEPQPLIQIYQSKAFEGHLPDETLMMFRLRYATLHWTDSIGGEYFDPKAPRDRPPCPQSTRHMRERMISETEPAAMVCIGGMEGVEQEYEIFREVGIKAPVYVFGETGGASALLADRRENGVRVIDREILGQLESLRSSQERNRDRRTLWDPEESRPVVPYPLIAQMLVEELSRQDLDWR